MPALLHRHHELDRYLAGAARTDPLPARVERALARRYRATGDPRIAERLIRQCLRLVVKIVNEYSYFRDSRLDLIQEGNLGLLQAVRKFDPARGARLCTYAAFWIRAYVLRAILKNHRLVQIGNTEAQREAFFHLAHARRRLEAAGIDPDEELARRFGMSGDELARLEQHLSAAETSFDATLVGDRLAAADERPDAACERSERIERLRARLAALDLDERERTLLRLRWLTDEPCTLQEVGDRFGVTRERVRQIERQLLQRLRTELEPG